MAGKKVTPMAELIPPLGVASRHSTDALALDEIFVAQPWVENTLNSWTKLRDVRLSDSSLSFNM
jgi:hypothetical protein